jgi:predicted lipoprotein with Yx(FWY)xxD motif
MEYKGRRLFRVSRLTAMVLMVVMLLVLSLPTGCGSAQRPPLPEQEVPPEIPTGGYTAYIVNIEGVGDCLVDGDGMTLYYFTKDSVGKSNATAEIIVTWPIFYEDSIVVPSTLKASDFGTIAGVGGNNQTTYKGWPLYTYSEDIGQGDTFGQGVNNVWFVVNPSKFPPTP